MKEQAAQRPLKKAIRAWPLEGGRETRAQPKLPRLQRLEGLVHGFREWPPPVTPGPWEGVPPGLLQG